MHCSSCGTPAQSDERRCTRCGDELPLDCPACGTVNGGHAVYCGRCGALLTPERPPDSASARSSRPPGDAARRASGRSAWKGERKQVTVLFADLGGSLSAIEGVDPEEAESLLDAVVAAMIDAVHRFGGTVNQVLGDGIMALFGAPTSHEDHAVRAACAALAMQATVRRLRSDSWAARKLTPEIRVGLNSGEVVIRTVATL